jgi:N6-L-threonylcarbamoyladenine synthase
LHDDRLQWSFAGLKTAVLYALGGQNAQQVPVNLSERLICDVAASFQEAVVEIIMAKTRQALTRLKMTRLGVGGGVAANRRLQQRLSEMAGELGVALFIPPPQLCTDNAAMAAIAFPKLVAGETSTLDIDVSAGLIRPGRIV